MPRDDSGFTLLEAVVVLAILVVVAGLAVSGLGPVQDDALANAARAELGTLRDACLRWRADVGAFPAALADLASATPPATLAPPLRAWNPELARGWRGPYLASARVVSTSALGDPWDEPSARRPYRYTPAASTATIASAGPDGAFGTADDIAVSFP